MAGAMWNLFKAQQPKSTITMAEKTTASMKPTLGLTGLTFNAMALIAPGAFLWLTFEEQALYGAPMAGAAMWFGFFLALLLCLATAISYAELSKLYPGAGSSYFYAEQAFLSKKKAFKYARVIKFFTGWASHLYYWVYPGLMVGVTALLGGYLAGRGVTGSTGVNIAMNVIQIAALMVFSIIALSYRMNHTEGATAIHLSNGTAINYQVDQTNVTDDKGVGVPDTWADGSPKYQMDDKGKPVAKTDDKGAAVMDKDGKPVFVAAIKQQDRAVTDDDLNKEKNKDADVLGSLTAMGLASGDPYPLFEKEKDGKWTKDKDGHLIATPFTISYTAKDGGLSGTDGSATDPQTFNYHESAASVVAPHNFSWLFVQACIAILCLVGFESVSSMAEEAKNPKRDVARAIILSLVIQGAVCYLIEYFCANYFLNNGYTMPNAGASSAPIGDMMKIVGTWAFGSAKAGTAFMLVQAFTVFLALIGTTLACLNTGARVTYAMGRDEEMGAHFGLLHEKSLTPHRAIWTLGIISIFIGIVTVLLYLGGTTPAALDKHNLWYGFGIFSPDTYAKMPNTLVLVTLISNFGTFLLYMTTCIVAMVAFKEHHSFHGFKHVVVPVFGVIANFICMLFYLIGPLPVNGSSLVPGMSWKEPYIALGVVAIWGIWGFAYLKQRSKAAGKPIFISAPPQTS
jgi:APA family basic amino acid/polyamine antiporter